MIVFNIKSAEGEFRKKTKKLGSQMMDDKRKNIRFMSPELDLSWFKSVHHPLDAPGVYHPLLVTFSTRQHNKFQVVCATGRLLDT